MATSSSKTSVPGVYRRGNGYLYVLSLGRNPVTGKKDQVWVGGFRTLAEAKAARNAASVKVTEGTYIAPSRVTFIEFMEERWLPAQVSRVRPGTLNLYWINWRRVRPRLGGVELRALDAARLQALYGELLERGAKQGRPLGARSVQIVHAFLHRCLADAVRWGLVARNPADLVDRPHAPRTEIRAWSPVQVRAFLDSVASDRLAALWRLIALTGVRRGEALGLRWVDVDLTAPRISIQQSLVLVRNKILVSEPKTANARRAIDLDPETARQLALWHDRVESERASHPDVWHDTGLVFVEELGGPLHPRTVTRLFARAAARAGLPAIRLHGLRHSHATAMLASGISPKIAQERLGHFSVSLTLDTYSHTLAGMQSAAARQVAALVDS
jgi:integrase